MVRRDHLNETSFKAAVEVARALSTFWRDLEVATG